MRKSQIVFFVLLFGFWLILSQEFDVQHLITGAILASFLAWFWGESVELLPEQSPNSKFYPKLLLYLVLLGWEIILANIGVVKTILAGHQAVDPQFVVFKPDLQTRWGRVLLANSITITPGTVTIDVNPDTDQFIVHAMTRDMADGVVTSTLIAKIQELESYRRVSQCQQ